MHINSIQGNKIFLNVKEHFHKVSKLNSISLTIELNRHFHIYFLVRIIADELKVGRNKRFYVFLLRIYLQNLQRAKKINKYIDATNYYRVD